MLHGTKKWEKAKMVYRASKKARKEVEQTKE